MLPSKYQALYPLGPLDLPSSLQIYARRCPRRKSSAAACSSQWGVAFPWQPHICGERCSVLPVPNEERCPRLGSFAGRVLRQTAPNRWLNRLAVRHCPACPNFLRQSIAPDFPSHRALNEHTARRNCNTQKHGYGGSSARVFFFLSFFFLSRLDETAQCRQRPVGKRTGDPVMKGGAG